MKKKTEKRKIKRVTGEEEKTSRNRRRRRFGAGHVVRRDLLFLVTPPPPYGYIVEGGFGFRRSKVGGRSVSL
jgi:hypothetical protein